MAASKFTVTHPDGTTSHRSSQTRTYTHAVQCFTPKAHVVADAQRSLDHVRETVATYESSDYQAQAKAQGYQTDDTLASNLASARVRVARAEAALSEALALPGAGVFDVLQWCLSEANAHKAQRQLAKRWASATVVEVTLAAPKRRASKGSTPAPASQPVAFQLTELAQQDGLW